MNTARWVLLDRDGVINADSDAYIKSPEEWQPIPGSLEAIVQLNQAGFSVGVATNQSGIARGFYNLDTLEAIHSKMHNSLKKLGGQIETVVYCPHGPNDNCECRKPMPGLLHMLAEKHGFSLESVYYVGDSFRDIEAAWAAGATPILVLTGKGAATLEKYAEKLQNVLVFGDLYAVALALTQPK